MKEHGILIDTNNGGNGYHGRCGDCGMALVTDLGYCSWDNTECIPKVFENNSEKKEKKKTWKDLERPTYTSDNKPICSESQMTKSIKGVENEMIKFLTKNKKIDIPEHFITGLTSVSSQAYYNLINNDTIIRNNGFIKLKINENN